MLHLHDDKLKSLEERANQLRQSVIEMLAESGSGHPAGSLGMADIFSAMYFHILRHDPKRPDWEDRDRLILSNGHICPIQYAALAHSGYFPLEELNTLRKLGSKLQGHPHRGSLPGIETTSGPLGSGISQALGMIMASNLDNKKHRVYCITSDGEHNEGNTYEAMLLAGKMGYDASRLTVIIDRNNIQIDGYTEKILPLDSLKEKYLSFNWHVISVNGHNIDAFVAAISEAHSIYEKPTVIIANTVPGKGVDFMENDYRWHGVAPGGGPEDTVPKDKQKDEALKQLIFRGKQIEREH